MLLLKRFSPLLLLFFGSFFVPCELLAQKEGTDPNGYNRFYHENGNLASEGRMENGKPTGLWKNYYPDGTIRSKGKRKGEELDSLWRFYDKNGVLKAEIWYENGKRDSVTKKYSKEGFLKKEFPYEEGKKEGTGYHYYPSGGKKMRIPFENGEKHGTAFKYNEEGRVITLLEYRDGHLRSKKAINRKNDSNQRSGPWRSFYPSGQLEWEGFYQKGKKHGIFKYYNKKGKVRDIRKIDNGKRLENSEDLMVLETKKEFYEDGTLKKEGSYKPDGTKHGLHKFFDEEGELETTKVFKNGNLTGKGRIDEQGYYQGEWVHYYPKGGKRAEGVYLNGKKEDEWVYYYPSGQVEQRGAYRNGEQEGTWKWFYKNGDIHRKEEYHDGLEDGPSVEYASDGSVLAEGDYIEGKKNGEWKYTVGDQVEKGEYVDGRRTGFWEHFYRENGELKFKGEYLDGTPKGEHIWYYPNGRKQLVGHYSMGKRDGTWKRYERDGRLVLTIRYEEGAEKEVNGKKIEPELEIPGGTSKSRP